MDFEDFRIHLTSFSKTPIFWFLYSFSVGFSFRKQARKDKVAANFLKGKSIVSFLVFLLLGQGGGIISSILLAEPYQSLMTPFKLPIFILGFLLSVKLDILFVLLENNKVASWFFKAIISSLNTSSSLASGVLRVRKRNSGLPFAEWLISAMSSFGGGYTFKILFSGGFDVLSPCFLFNALMSLINVLVFQDIALNFVVMFIANSLELFAVKKSMTLNDSKGIKVNSNSGKKQKSS